MSDTQKPNQGNREGGNRRPRRNNNNNRNRNNNNGGGGGNNRNRNRNRNNRPPKPLVLTFWQKILKAIGCLDEDKLRKAQRPQRSQKKQDTPKSAAPKSNVRNAKTGGKGTSEKPRRRAPQPVAVNSARLYVGNLSYEATEFDLEDLFKGVGTVKNVEIIYNRNTHKSKGYGFIQMLNKEEAERAVEVLHDQPFMGRQLVVNGSKSRKDGDTSGETKTDESADSAE